MTSGREDCFDSQYYGNLRRLLTTVGLWPYLETSKQIFCFYFITIMMVIAIIGQICLLLTSEPKVEAITELLQTFLPTITFAAGYWNLLYNSDQMKKTIVRVRNDWNKLTCEAELRVMHKYAAQSKVCSQSIACAFSIYVAFLICPCITQYFLYIFGVIDRTKLTLPVQNKIFMASELSYFLFFSSEITIISTTCVIGITHYSMFISLLQHACALFIIVTNEIDRPFIKDGYKLFSTQTSSKEEAEFEWIVAVVKNYKNAIKFVDELKSLYGKMYIVEVSLILCFIIIDFIYCFQLLNLTLTAGESLRIFLYVNGSLPTIYAYFYFGERLIGHSNSVYAKCRLVPFYTLSVRTNKLFLLLIMNTMKPCNISISGIVVASHELFAKMMKASFSFATVCYRVR